MIEKFIADIKSQTITINQWVLGFLGIIFVRFFFESFSSKPSDGIISSDPYTLVHYLMFFLCVTLGSLIIIGYFTKDYKNAPKILLFGLPVLWIAPILDLFISSGFGYKMTYVFDSGKQLFLNLFTFFGPVLNSGATYGMRFGIAIIIIGFGLYVWYSTRSKLRGFIGALCMYLLIFSIGSLPGILYTVSHPENGATTKTEVMEYFKENILLSTISHNTLREGVNSVSDIRFVELGFNKLITQILFILSVIFGAIFFYKVSSLKFLAIIKNARPERVNFYTASLFSGICFAYINQVNGSFVWIDIFGIISLFVSWVGLWMYAVHTNDIVDVEIDKISNKERPLVKGVLSADDMYQTGNIWLAVALLGSWSAGYYPFFMSLIYISASYIYSVPPLRLRRFPIISSFLIGIACLATILAGYFFISIYKNIEAFPIFLAFGIVVMVTLAINFKDIKDIEGDRKNGIMTIPTLFEKRGIQIVAVLFGLSILLVPFFLSFYFLYIIAIPSAIIGYRLILKKPYKEKPIFVLRFVFLFGIALFYALTYFLGHFYNII